MLDSTNPCDLHRAIEKINGEFFVPAYQRGYRWKEDDVRRLLDDIESSRNKDDKADYTLQPVVVRHRPADGSLGDTESSERWELIDGQQRLTTLYLIFLVMKDKGWRQSAAPFSLHYETRQRWNDFRTDVLDKAETNIDFHHLAEAYRCIADWFAQWGNDTSLEKKAIQFFIYLTEHVKVIWYEPLAIGSASPAEVEQESIAMFTRLNVGRIPLTDAELVKASLLTKVRENSPDREHELAAQWDSIERDLQRPEVWAFVSALDKDSTATAFPTRIGLLLDTLADKGKPPEHKRKSYQTFETLRTQIAGNPKTFWQDVTALHAQIIGWMEDPIWHNKIGFLITSKYRCFANFVEAARLRRKSELSDWLTAEISKAIDLSANRLDELRYDNKGHRPILMNVLLLFNVEALTLAGSRFPFAEHANEGWSLEHIHAQSSEGMDTEAQWREWLKVHLKALQALSDTTIPHERANERQKLESDIAAATTRIRAGKNLAGEEFFALHARTVKFFDSGEPDHSIRNLALLSSRDNSRLNNAVFEAKRQVILELDRAGGYIPLCTRHVFLKYYATTGTEQLHFWSDGDKKAYLDVIASEEAGIGLYLKKDHPNKENG